MKRKHINRAAVFIFAGMMNKIVVAGAGTMGSGIALTIAQSSKEVILFDTNQTVIEKASLSVLKNLDFLVSKQKISKEDKTSIFRKIKFTSEISECIGELVIEAIIEKIDVKQSLFEQLSELNDKHTVFASNTSSLSISRLQERIEFPGRVAGLHFFNPAHIMKLVEVVRGLKTEDDVVHKLMEFTKDIGKVAVLCNDSPGFIVNRVARHYYLEAMKLVENGIASFEEVDEIMESTGFKMGPFRLMDLIGMDINLAVSESLYFAFNSEPRFQPSPIQVKKVSDGHLGRKTGQGFYNY